VCAFQVSTIWKQLSTEATGSQVPLKGFLMKHMVVSWGLIAACIAMDSAAASEQKYVSAPPLPLFASESILQIKVRTDFSSLIGRRYGYGTEKLARQFQPVDLELIGPEAKRFAAVARALVSGRGALRGNECPFPQLKIDFEKRPGRDIFFQGIKELKMVTHCGASVTGRSVDFNELVRMEYLVYKIRQAASDLSFHVRLLNVTYEDTSGTLAPFQSYAIFVEDISDLAKRLKVDRVYNPSQVEARPELANLVLPNVTQVDPVRRGHLQMFQIMIGNYDYHWGHNLKGISGPFGFDLVPYDFDYADIFDKPMHSNGLYLQSGLMACLSSVELKAVLTEISRRKDLITNVVAKTDLISELPKQLALESLKRFFKDVSANQIPDRGRAASGCPSDQ
jgi:hypothetical protein